MAESSTDGTHNALRVIEDLATIYANEQLFKHGLKGWSIAWHDQGEMAGRCSFGPKIITLNRRVLLNTAARNIRETILHEITHALVAPDVGHGQLWYEKLLEIGGTGIWVFNDGRVVCHPLEEGK